MVSKKDEYFLNRSLDASKAIDDSIKIANEKIYVLHGRIAELGILISNIEKNLVSLKEEVEKNSVARIKYQGIITNLSDSLNECKLQLEGSIKDAKILIKDLELELENNNEVQKEILKEYEKFLNNNNINNKNFNYETYLKYIIGVLIPLTAIFVSYFLSKGT